MQTLDSRNASLARSSSTHDDRSRSSFRRDGRSGAATASAGRDPADVPQPPRSARRRRSAAAGSGGTAAAAAASRPAVSPGVPQSTDEELAGVEERPWARSPGWREDGGGSAPGRGRTEPSPPPSPAAAGPFAVDESVKHCDTSCYCYHILVK